MTKKRATQRMSDLFEIDHRQEIHTTSTEPVDQFQRDQALDITRSWIVEAPAGSGKTGLLIQRYLKLLAQPEVQEPEQVLAITFTLKAAGEIRERILENLDQAARPDPKDGSVFSATAYALASAVLERDLQMGWGILDHPRRLNVRTIDSLCSEISRSLPVLAGGSGLKPVEDSMPLHRLAAERTLLQLGGSDRRLSDALSTILLHRDGDLQKCRELLAEMLALRDQWGRLIPLDRGNLEEEYLDNVVLQSLERTLSDAVCTELVHLNNEIPVRLLERLSTLAGDMGTLQGNEGRPSPIAICGGRYLPPEAKSADLEIWQALIRLLIRKGEWRRRFRPNDVRFMITKWHREQLEEIASELRGHHRLLDLFTRISLLPPLEYPSEQWAVAKALFVVLHRALAELQIVFAERGECDFMELGLLARSALNHGEGGIDPSLGVDFQHLLIDEMQDTSTSQYELIQLLTQGWDGRSQTVFLVGDPKQSIYLFRQARVERFVRMMNDLHLGEVNLGLLRLNTNFRSQPGLVEAFNGIFSSIFPTSTDNERSEEATYVEARAIRDPLSTDARNSVWHPLVIAPNRQDVPAELGKPGHDEALQVRHVIEQWRGKPRPNGSSDPWKIAVLVRNRSHLKHIVAELKQDRASGPIPFRAIDIEPLGQRPEVLDLFALTRAILHPADRVAWLSVLRAPWCGLELADIHLLCGGDHPRQDRFTIAELIGDRGHLLSQSSIKLLERIGPVLTAVNKQVGRIPLAELVERTWRTLNGDVYLSLDEKRNAEQYLNLLYEIERQGVVLGLDLLRQRMEKLYAVASSEPGAIDLMTIHGAKGLEWDVVLLPGLDKRTQGDSQRLLAWDELSSGNTVNSDVILAPIVGKGRDSEALNEWLKDVHRRRQEAESKRLFYVACTRAREELHLFATLKRNHDGSLKPKQGTLLAAAWPAAERYFVNVDTYSEPISHAAPAHSSSSDSISPALTDEVEQRKPRATLRRLRCDFVPRLGFSSVQLSSRQDVRSFLAFDRPEGSYESRAFGSTVHELLEYLSRRVAAGNTAEALRGELPSWDIRINALLRSHGLSLIVSQRLTPLVQQALLKTLGDSYGLWLLNPHADAASEQALTAWDDDIRTSYRLDRVFRAGAEPFDTSRDYVWIVDYKTTHYAGERVEEFLKQERSIYSPQMDEYAKMIRDTKQTDKLRVALYFPLLPKLIWWNPEL